MQLYDLAGESENQSWSPFCWRIKLALRHKNIVFETVPWRYFQKEEFASRGLSTVPVLVDGDRQIEDSWNIAEYLDSAYPSSPRLFAGPSERGTARFIKHWIESEVHVRLRPITLLPMFQKLDPRDRDYFRRSREERLGRTLEAVSSGDHRAEREALRDSLEPARRLILEQPYIAGETPGFSDHIVAGALLWGCFACSEDLLESSDPLAQWRDELLRSYGISPKF